MDNDLELRKEIHENLRKIKTAKDIFSLLKKLNYPENVVFDISSKRKKSTFDFKKEDEQRIKEIYSVLSFDEKLHVFLLEVSTLTPSFIRSVTSTFDKQYLHFLLIFSSDYSEIVFVFPNREKIEAGKHKLKLTKLIVNRDEIHYTDIQTLSNISYEGEGNWRDIWRKWKKAFSVERVTEDFFEDYKNIFFTLRNELNKQSVPIKESHEFTLQFLNRIMFIYFISKKKWLEHPRFMEWVWTAYKKLNKYGSDEFYEKWLRQIFFKAFNNRSNELAGLPGDIIKAISNSPYLNGGLFRENGLDNLKIKISDKMFERIFEFFEKYNFTIKEDMPLEQEVAVDPQMIGYVYESLANVAEEIYDRNDLGIFYTPRVEVDFMCRRSLVEYLSKHLPEVPKEKFYHLIFDLPEEKEKIEKWFSENNLCSKLEEILDELSVVDPACGSGAFLVGMLNVLAEVYRSINKHLNRNLTDFQLKNRIIQYSLYGVDVMTWAIHAAELRLWLQLIVETEFKKEELRKHPLLPNLNLNLRIGDSLVQEIGGISFNLKTNNLKPHLKKKLEDLKQEKRKYFENSPTAKFKTPEEVKAEEIRLFEEIIDERIESLETDIEVLENSEKKKEKQTGLFGSEINIEAKNIKKEKEEIEKIEKKIQDNKKEIENLKKVKELLKEPDKKPFVWDIDFAEIFAEKNGFDIVIGNPPYVRQEMISPPNKLKSEVTLEDRREYKEKLINSVKKVFPVVENIDKKSDYYIYFYFHGLGLLNEKGTFCFITSNSWLDVGYGKELQEFLCKYVPILGIYDNPKRSFAHADVNTIIALFGAPKFAEEKTIHGFKISGNENNWPMLNHTAKFVMFKKPFEEVVNSKNLIEIENIKVETKGEGITELVKNVKKTDDYRCFPILQGDLLEDGWEYPENYQKEKGRFKAGSYEGNKWGGKFLRAPDIFYTILEKGKGKLVRLGDIAEVRRGFTTGANEFFYLPSKYFDIKEEEKYYKLIPKEEGLPNDIKIEKEFLKPVIKSPRECKTILINPNDLKYKVFMCHKTKNELKGTGALKYIEWGENVKVEIKQGSDEGKKIKGFQNISTVKNRELWYSLQSNFGANIFIQMSFNDTFPFYYSQKKMLADARLYEIKIKDFNSEQLALSLNSTLSVIFMELFGRSNLGEGALDFKVYEAKKILFIIKNIRNNKILRRKPNPIFTELGFDPSKPIREQEPKPLPDRAELDKIIFDELGLSEEEKKEVYWAVAELVKQRIDKAKSVKRD